MNKLTIKIILSIAIGILVGTIAGNLENNKIITYYITSSDKEISKDKFNHIIKQNKTREIGNAYYIDLLKKSVFNKELGFYYGLITCSSLIILLLVPTILKKQDY